MSFQSMTFQQTEKTLNMRENILKSQQSKPESSLPAYTKRYTKENT